MTVNETLWGKLDEATQTSYPLVCHLLDTVASATVIWSEWLRPGLRSFLARTLGDGDEDLARRKFAAIAGLHDLGKASAFQSQRLSGRRPSEQAQAILNPILRDLEAQGYSLELPLVVDDRVLRPGDSVAETLRRHEAVGLFGLSGSWPAGDDRIDGLWAALVVGGHHGRFHPREPETGSDSRATQELERLFRALAEGNWGEQQEAHRDLVLATVGLTLAELQEPPAESAGIVITLVTGMVILADWLASEETAVAAGMELRAEVSPVATPERWVEARTAWFAARIEYTVGVYRDLPNAAESVLGDHAAHPSQLQREAQSVSRGLWIAAVPTGEGKTEAAFLRHLAVPGEGIIFALPTRSTTDAMFSRAVATFAASGNAAALAHSYSDLNPFYSGEMGLGLHHQEWHDRRATRLFAPVSVSTCDQVLLGALRQRGLPLRLLALANKHVVLDEVHTYDTYQSALLEQLLAWLGATDTRVTLLSASIPTRQRERLMAAYAGAAIAVPSTYPAHYGVADGHGTVAPVDVRKRYRVRFVTHRTTEADYLADVAERALRYYRDTPGARVGIICNTIDRAVELTRVLQEAGAQVITLHSRMTAGHRAALGQRLEEALGAAATRTEPLIVVGTQVIEASLDVDFDHLLTDLAPAPSLVQRAGRLWRHSAVVAGQWQHRRAHRTGIPTVDVYRMLDGEVLPAVALVPYQAVEQKRTLRALRDLTDGVLAVPEGVQAFVDAAAIPEDGDAGDETAIPAVGGVGDETAITEGDDQKNLLAIRKRVDQAAQVVVRMRDVGRRRGLLGERATVAVLAESTRPQAEPGEARTRFIEVEKATALLLDPAGVNPWAFPGDVAAARAAALGGADERRALLAATIPLSRSEQARLVGARFLADETAETGFLRGIVPLILDDSGAYDPTVGPTVIPRRTPTPTPLPGGTHTERSPE